MLQLVYFAHFLSQFRYGTIFWGSSSPRNVFIIKKRAIRIMLILGPRREAVSKKFDILKLPCLHIYALMLLAVKILIFVNLTPLFMLCIQGSKINYLYLW
jgi:hypothetical protein